MEGDAAGVNQLSEAGLNFTALEADLGERGRVPLHPEVARLLGPLERAEKLAGHKVLVNKARGLMEVELGAPHSPDEKALTMSIFSMSSSAAHAAAQKTRRDSWQRVEQKVSS